MNIILFLIIGGLVGWIAGQVAGRDEGVIASIIIGIVGSFIGSYVSRLFTGADQAYLTFSWVALFWSFMGALILVLILNAIQGRSAHNRI